MPYSNPKAKIKLGNSLSRQHLFPFPAFVPESYTYEYAPLPTAMFPKGTKAHLNQLINEREINSTGHLGSVHKGLPVVRRGSVKYRIYLNIR